MEAARAAEEAAITAAAIAETKEAAGLSDSEKTLVKGMANKSWTGPPLLESVTGALGVLLSQRQTHDRCCLCLLDHAPSLRSGKPLEVSLIPGMKKRKGKKKDSQVAPALERIMGYAGSDMSEEEVVASSEESNSEDEANKEDGVVDREYIKLRALKMSARHAGQRVKA